MSGVKQTHKMTIQNVAVNRPLEDALFGKPQLAMASCAGPVGAADEPVQAHRAGCLLLAGLALAALAQVPAPSLTAAEIVEKNAAARGGVEAWRKGSDHGMGWPRREQQRPQTLPFQLAQQRPDHTRFEIVADGQKSVRVFDGSHGWKMRQTSSGRPEVSPYSEDELRFARGAQVIEGPLMDYVARRAAVTLAGLGETAGRKAYILSVALPSGGNHRVWVDAENLPRTASRPRSPRWRPPAERRDRVLSRLPTFRRIADADDDRNGGDHGPGDEPARHRTHCDQSGRSTTKSVRQTQRSGVRRSAVLVDTRGAAASTSPAR